MGWLARMQVTRGKLLRGTVDDLRRDKMNVKKKMEEKKLELQERCAEAVQLINIANDFYTQRAQYRLAASALIADAGKEAEVVLASACLSRAVVKEGRSESKARAEG